MKERERIANAKQDEVEGEEGEEEDDDE